MNKPKVLQLTAGNPKHVKEMFAYNNRVSAHGIFNTRLGIGFIRSSVVGFVTFKTAIELYKILIRIFPGGL